MSNVCCTAGELEAAVVASASTARWPDGSLLLDLDVNVLRDVLMPRLHTTRPILDLIPGDLAVLPTLDGTTTGPVTIEWVREAPDGTVCAGWHTPGQDHKLRLPLDLAARGALVLVPGSATPAPAQLLTQAA